MAFQILALSGGGYRGLFTIDVLARLEQEAGKPLHQCFDMIAGTSIGGIVAIGLAMGKSAESIRDEFLKHGEDIFPRKYWFKSPYYFLKMLWGPKYSAAPLRAVIENVVGKNTKLGQAKTRLLVPAVNMTKSQVQMFKTPHHPNLKVDQHRLAVDIALATSAAPTFFPMAKFDDSLFIDGGIVANAPDLCAIHEAVEYCGVEHRDIRLLSVGTTTKKFSLPNSIGVNLGRIGWIRKDRLPSTLISAQQQLVDFMLKHQLTDRYLRIDALPSEDQTSDLGLDVADTKRRSTLQGLASGAYQEFISNKTLQDMLNHEAPRYENRTTLSTA
ncbi:CBASS cGAMP-activated phospholipase [Mesorhizobium sp. SP-1A]|uniref:CBASS cGAMP-activated phospholipase n=1 Tax=Mesorhizobium sp. SP-1A TaxID=3077840 RepID=UPI0028F6CC9A|nr:CBASS cGAMP-activated phospholipase [Mesorhizobium sp. SP-1A]